MNDSLGKSNRRVRLPLAVIVASLLIILLVREIAAVRRIAEAVQTANVMLQGDTTGGAGQLEKLDTLFSQAAQDYAELRGFIAPVVLVAPLFSWLPRYGDTLAQAPTMLEFGDQCVASARDALAMGRALNLAATGSDQASPGKGILQYTLAHASEVAQANRNLAQAQRARARVHAETLSPSFRDLIQRADRFLIVWQTVLQGLAWSPGLMGQDRPRLYLLLAQNSDELRATGGFISAVGLIQVDQGEITVLDFRDSFAVDNVSQVHPAPPLALQQYMHAGMWVLRDVNWSPDFPTVARWAEQIYQIDQAVTVDGVIAVNLQIVPRILKGVGPITLEDGETITADNALAKFQTYWSTRGAATEAEWWKHRKDFMGKFLEQLLVRLRSRDLDQVSLARALYDSIMAKDLLVYANLIPEAELAAVPWSGRLYRGPGDALMIVDSNVGFNKVDSNIERQADYTVHLDRGEIQATLAISYTNLSSPNGTACVLQAIYLSTYSELQQGCYWNYLRVVVPIGTSVLKATADFRVEAEPIASEGRLIFGGSLLVPRGESRSIQFEYLLPPTAQDPSTYVLHLEKQPGAPPLSLKVHIFHDESMRVKSALPTPVREQGNVVEFEIKLDQDQEISLVFEPKSPSLSAGAFILVALLTGAGAWLVHRRKPVAN